MSHKEIFLKSREQMMLGKDCEKEVNEGIDELYFWSNEKCLLPHFMV